MAGVLYVFGFIVAATLGATAGSIDLTEGMFRHLVVTGRSRLSLYLARIPAGLAIIVPLVAIGFTIVCAVCVFAAPTQLNFQGTTVPTGLSQAGLENWAAGHTDPGHLRLQLQDRHQPPTPRWQRGAVRPQRPRRPRPGRRRHQGLRADRWSRPNSPRRPRSGTRPVSSRGWTIPTTPDVSCTRPTR